ncbi:MAG TPA: large-conductance mechanosensitive channel protein MscL [bacterium]|jgi:large conductance mechanosensitive channel|nr:large-conductance mechanosensitive channel protein MscL [bacterium]HOG38625.1 large-conductance mechanosensitive channel protein MscL [bacterium]HQI03459.1 large-conductance mechanosensitive channel protein MscL [bacterium]
MSILKEFKKFAVSGSVMDMAVGVIIGGAFGKIVTSLVNDVIMPPIGVLLGIIDFSKLKIILKNSPDPSKIVSLNYGAFLNTVIDFLIIAFCIFIAIKQINKLKKEEKKQPETKEEILLLREIRDNLKKE